MATIKFHILQSCPWIYKCHCPFWAVISTDRRNTLIFKKDCSVSIILREPSEQLQGLRASKIALIKSSGTFSSSFVFAPELIFFTSLRDASYRSR